MKNLLTLSGGYRRYQDYLLTVQNELNLMGNSILGSVSFDVVLAGCAVTDNHDGTVSIAPGIVYIAGQVMRFDGAASIAADGSKAIVAGTPVTSGPVVFADTSTKNVYSEIKGVVANSAGGPARQLIIGVTLLTFEAYIDARIAGTATKGQIKEFVFSTLDDINAFKAKFDVTGLGIAVDTVGWALMNGNNGTVNAQCRVFIGVGGMVDPNTGTELIIGSGDEGGEITHLLSSSEVPRPAGLVPGANGPHNKPADGGGTPIYYMTGTPGTSAAGIQHNNMQPYIGTFKMQKL